MNALLLPSNLKIRLDCFSCWIRLAAQFRIHVCRNFACTYIPFFLLLSYLVTISFLNPTLLHSNPWRTRGLRSPCLEIFWQNPQKSFQFSCLISYLYVIKTQTSKLFLWRWYLSARCKDACTTLYPPQNRCVKVGRGHVTWPLVTWPSFKCHVTSPRGHVTIEVWRGQTQQGIQKESWTKGCKDIWIHLLEFRTYVYGAADPNK